MSNMNSSQISVIIKKYRKLSGLTQKGLADLSGVGKTVIYDLEKGKEGVQLKTLLRVLEVLNIKLDLIVPFNPEEKAPD